MYESRSLKDYLNDLAARKPAPGGGSAAALSASIGAGLISMVANYTVGNPKYKDCEKQASAILAKSEGFRTKFLELVDRDVEAYQKLSDGTKAAGKDAENLDKLFKEAVTPPFEICKLASEALELCKELAACGNKNLITDTAIAAILMEGAFFSAKYNVYANLKNVKDIDFVGKTHAVLAPLEETMPALKEEILEMCEDVISR